jgi:hypothetical protein
MTATLVDPDAPRIETPKPLSRQQVRFYIDNGYLAAPGMVSAEELEELDFSDESHGFDESAQVPVEVKAGTAAFFNGYLLHRSFKNRSGVYRRVLVSHYMNAWSHLPWSIKEGEAPSRTDRRCIVPVAGIDPYAWKGYEAPQNVYLRTCKANEGLIRPAAPGPGVSEDKK